MARRAYIRCMIAVTFPNTRACISAVDSSTSHYELDVVRTAIHSQVTDIIPTNNIPNHYCLTFLFIFDKLSHFETRKLGSKMSYLVAYLLSCKIQESKVQTEIVIWRRPHRVRAMFLYFTTGNIFPLHVFCIHVYRALCVSVCLFVLS